MDKPGPRPAQPVELIINNRGVLRLRDRWTEVGVTLFFWGLLLYLWQPLLSFAAWLFQSYFIYHHMISLGGYASFAQSALHYVLFILLIDAIFLLWARLNLVRFRGKERRDVAPKASLTKQCAYFGVDQAAVTQWRDYKQMVVSFDSLGNITNAKPCSLAHYREAQG